MEYIKHNLRRDIQVYTDGTIIEEKLISISFKNIGVEDAFIGPFPLLAGDPMITFGNEVPNEDITSYNLTFGKIGGAKRVVVIKTRIVNTFKMSAIKTCNK